MAFLSPNTTSRITAKTSPLSVRNQRMPHHFTANVRLYQGTIRFNILLGANHDASQEEIDQAAKNANVLTHLSQLLT
jgi:ABC-type transport system involved in cytochrome bd biosynthesis fused ATPase/permease subunit